MTVVAERMVVFGPPLPRDEFARRLWRKLGAPTTLAGYAVDDRRATAAWMRHVAVVSGN